ncbi:MAG: hypothetical protein F4Y02_01935 [Chloroflexi bacterium]|nr:hypothetical protein [Chloroflexota bacterium]
MPVKANVKVTGGDRARRFFKNAGKGGVNRVRVGFFSQARYPNGTPVASVALWNEFGTRRNGEEHAPERPFFRQAIRQMADDIPKILENGIDPARGVLDRRLAGRIGSHAQGLIERQIQTLDEPENADSTIARKGTGKKPLIDTSLMLQSVTFRVDE